LESPFCRILSRVLKRCGSAAQELRIVIADDSGIIREHLQRAISRTKGLKLVGAAENGVEALSLVQELNPDVAILDISMPHKNGLEVLKEIRRNDSSTVIIMFTGETSELLKNTCLEQGANHFFCKSDITAMLEKCQDLLLRS